MSDEYVRISKQEKIYGKGLFLRSELGLLNFVRGLRRYNKTREEDFKLKVSLKSKLGELANLMDEFISLLPKTEYKLEGMEDIKLEKEEISVEREIEAISKKLERLQAGM